MKPQPTQTPLSWFAYKVAHPKVRIRTAAAELGVSELELLISDIGEHCIRLTPDILPILEALPTLGKVMALTRNDAVVHEATYPFSELHLRKQTALFLRPGQDTRFFTQHWKHVVAVNENNRHSLQFFDAYGDAAHKIFLVEDSDHAQYQQLVTQFKAAIQSNEVSLDKKPDQAASDAPIDVDALRQRWSQMKDVHEAGQIIKSFNPHRSAIYTALSDEYAVKLPYNVVEQTLSSLSVSAQESIIFVQNHAAVQSYSGIIKRLLRTGPWFNVLDAGFNLHLNTEMIGQVWLIRKPSAQGDVHSLNVLDHNNNEVMIMTDKRARDEQESTQWKALVRSYV